MRTTALVDLWIIRLRYSNTPSCGREKNGGQTWRGLGRRHVCGRVIEYRTKKDIETTVVVVLHQYIGLSFCLL